MTEEAENPRAIPGDNQPPEPTPLEQHAETIDGLFVEAGNWLDGSTIANQAQADEVTRLRDMAKKASKAANAQRVVEKKPHDDAANAVQQAWKPLIDKADKIDKVAGGAISTWLIAEQARNQKEADDLAKLAREAEDRARREHQAAAATGDLARLDAAENTMAQAEMLDKEARASGGFKAQAKVEGMTRAIGLRTVHDVALAEHDTADRELAQHFWRTQRETVIDFYLGLARTAVKAGARKIPGCTITPRQTV